MSDISPEAKRPNAWRINAWLAEISEPPPSRGSFYNWCAAGLVEIAKVQDITFVLTDPLDFLARHRVPTAPKPETPPVPEDALQPEPAPPPKRGRGRPRKSPSGRSSGSAREMPLAAAPSSE
jgi:hypothetical protein